MKPICTACARFYRAKHTGVRFIEAMPNGRVQHPPSGNAAPDQWKPYKLWVGDLWECHGCGHELIVGVAPVPIAEHHQHHFDAALAGSIVHVTVNDC